MIEERLHAELNLQPGTPEIKQQGSLSDLANLTSRHQRLLGLANYVTKTDSMSPDQSRLQLIRDLGLSSLDMVELVLLLEKQSAKVFDQLPMAENTTLGELRSLLTDRTQAQRVRKRDLREPPGWAEWLVLNHLRRFSNPVVLHPWTHLVAIVKAAGRENLAGLSRPVIFAVNGHEGGFDLLLIYRALPAHLRRDLAVVMSRVLFGLRFDADTTLMERLGAILGLKVLLPLFFPYVLSSHFERTRDSLFEACRLVDRGYSLVSFGGEGVAVVAKQCGVPIVPVQLKGNEGASFKPRYPRLSVSVTFGRPMNATPEVIEDQLLQSLNGFFAHSNQAS